MRLKHRKPCGLCPFRRQAAPGFLGEANPDEFVDATLADADMPCHATVNYEDPEWRDQRETDDVAFCAGAIIFQRNTCQLSRNRRRAGPEADRMAVFSNRYEFLLHHDREEYAGDDYEDAEDA